MKYEQPKTKKFGDQFGNPAIPYNPYGSATMPAAYRDYPNIEKAVEGYLCKVCGRVFKHKIALLGHLKAHSKAVDNGANKN